MERAQKICPHYRETFQSAACPVSVSLFAAAELSDDPASVQARVIPIKTDEKNEYRRGLLLGLLCAGFI